MPALDLFMK
uniref:Uncharacterized protein n=1 Tax=Bracon brevicornis TaxID=1563983 RepID=A0A6V7LSM1_9HYME